MATKWLTLAVQICYRPMAPSGTTEHAVKFARILNKLKRLAFGDRDAYYQRYSRDLHLMLICEGLSHVLKALFRRANAQGAPIRTAIVGSHHSLFENAEFLAELGFELSYFAGRPNDVYHVSKPLLELVATDFDCILLADETREEQLYNQVVATGAAPIRIIQLLNAHISVLKSMKTDGTVSCLNPRKQAIVTALLAIADPKGIVVECGVYMGGTTIQMALLQRALGVKRRIFALDTYEGMPEPTASDFGGGFVYEGGTFADTHKELVGSFYRKAGVNADIDMVQGLCQDTLPAIIGKNSNVAFAFLDTDQYAGTKGGLEAIAPILQNNAVILIDDTTVHGVDTAIREALAQDQTLVRAPLVMNFDMVWRPATATQ
jgi:predicted O-methyltransferase YrrM